MGYTAGNPFRQSAQKGCLPMKFPLWAMGISYRTLDHFFPNLESPYSLAYCDIYLPELHCPYPQCPFCPLGNRAYPYQYFYRTQNVRDHLFFDALHLMIFFQ